MKYLLWMVLILAALYILHHLGLWAERRGWVYYRKKGCSSGAVGNAFLELQAFLEPSKRHVVEERKKTKSDERESGDKPQAGC